jgi:hypothetical protein
MPLLLSFLCKSKKIFPEDYNIDSRIPIHYLDAKYEQEYSAKPKKNKVVPMPVYIRR